MGGPEFSLASYVTLPSLDLLFLVCGEISEVISQFLPVLLFEYPCKFLHDEHHSGSSAPKDRNRQHELTDVLGRGGGVGH